MTQPIAQASPWPSARITGVIYLLYFLTAIPGVLLINKLVAPGDPAATATNIMAHEPQYRLGLAIGLISTALYIAVTALFYGFFRPVNRTIALLAAFFRLLGCAVQAGSSVFQLAPLVIFGGGSYLSAFNTSSCGRSRR